MADKKKKKARRCEFLDDVSHIGLMELVEIRKAEMENYMLPNQQTTISNWDGSKKVIIKSRELNITEKMKRRAV